MKSIPYHQHLKSNEIKPEGESIKKLHFTMSEYFQINETNDRYLVVYQIEEIEEKKEKTNEIELYYIT